MRHVEGAPFGTRGGTAVVHHFPADGTYTFQNELYFYYLGELIGGNLPESLQGQELEISIDGARVRAFTIDPLYEGNTGPLVTPPIAVTAGPHRVAAAFVAKADGAGRRLGAPGGADDARRQRRPASRHDHAAAPADDDDRRADAAVGRVRHAEPRATSSPARRPGRPQTKGRAPRRIVTTLARRAFRRPPTDDDIDDADADVRGRAARTATSRTASARRCRRRSRVPSSSSASSACPSGVTRRPELPHRRPRAGVAALVLPVGQRPRRRAASPLASAGRAARAGGARAAGQAHAGRPARREPGHALRGPVAAAHRPGRGASRSRRSSPTSPATSAQSMRREVELLFDSIVREDRSIARPAHRRLHVRRTRCWRGTTASPTSPGRSSGA